MQIDRPIAIILTLIATLVLVYVLVLPEYNTFTKLQTELGIKKAEFNAEYDYYAAINKTYRDLQNRPDDIKKIDDALPQDPALGKLVYFLQGTAKENGLVVKDLSLSKSSTNSTATTSSNVKSINFSMDLLGNYASLEGFMMALEKSSRLFEITTISFGSVQAGETYNFNLQIKTYSY